VSGPGYDLAIIGSGGAAFSAAIAARERDLRVVMIERGAVGGTCVNVGCIPSKALLAAAEQRSRAVAQPFPGIRTDAGPADMAVLVAGKNEIVESLRQEKYLDLAERYDIELVHGEARFSEGLALEVDGRAVEAAAYLVATGSTPRIPDLPGLAASGYLTSTTVMELDALPRSLIVLGGGYVALELAQLFAHLGTDVTLVARSRVARREEPEIADALRDALTADGIRILERTAAHSVRRDGTCVTVSTDAGGLDAEQLLVATGRRPQIDGLGLQAAGVEVGQDGAVLVDDQLRTSSPRTQTHRELRQSCYSPFLKLREKWEIGLGAGRSQVQILSPRSTEYDERPCKEPVTDPAATRPTAGLGNIWEQFSAGERGTERPTASRTACSGS
jgi:mercuric reductase